VKGMYATK